MHGRQAKICNLPIQAGPCNSARMDQAQEATRRFVTELLRATGWTAYRMAKKAGLSHTTITRFLNDPEVDHVLSSRTLMKMRQAASEVLQPDYIDEIWAKAQRPPAQVISASANVRR